VRVRLRLYLSPSCCQCGGLPAHKLANKNMHTSIALYPGWVGVCACEIAPLYSLAIAHDSLHIIWQTNQCTRIHTRENGGVRIELQLSILLPMWRIACHKLAHKNMHTGYHGHMIATHTCIHPRTHPPTHAHAHTQTHTHTHLRTRTHTLIHAHTRTCTRTHTHTHTHTHTSTRTHTHTHTHTPTCSSA